MGEAKMNDLYRVIVVRGTTLVAAFVVPASSEAEAIQELKEESDRSRVVCNKPYYEAGDLVAASKLDVHKGIALVFNKSEYHRRSASG